MPGKGRDRAWDPMLPSVLSWMLDTGMSLVDFSKYPLVLSLTTVGHHAMITISLRVVGR